MTTSDTMSDNNWQWMQQRMATGDSERKQLATIENEWQQVAIKWQRVV